MTAITQRNRVGTVASILIGILDMALIIYVIAIPAEQRFDMGQFFINYAENPLTMSIAWIVLAATSLLALTVIPAVYRIVQPLDEEWAQFASLIGIVGYAVGAVSFLTLLGHTPRLAEAYVSGNSATRAAIVAIGIPEIDPLKVLIMGAPGVWFVTINLLAWRARMFGRLHSGIGILLGFGHWAATLAMLIHSETLDIVAAGIGALLAPIWFIWLGVKLDQK